MTIVKDNIRESKRYKLLSALYHRLPFSEKNKFWTSEMVGDLMCIVESLRNRLIIAHEHDDKVELGHLNKIIGFLKYQEDYKGRD